MKHRNVIAAVILAAFLAATPLMLMAKPARAQDGGQNTAALMTKLDQVMEGQRSIMSQLDAIKQELNVIKVRVTQSQ